MIYQDDSKHVAVALKWVGSEPGSAGYLASLAVARTKNSAELVQSLERWKVPALNFVFADIDGAIGWVAAGMTPIRAASNGLLPVPGASTKYDWQGFLNVGQLPQIHNPTKHFVATANHNILPRDYQQSIAYDWAAPFRFQRIEQRLTAKPRFTLDDFQSIQHEATSLLGQQLVEVLKANASAISAEHSASLRLLLDWNGVLSKDSAGGALYSVWLHELMTRFFAPRLPTAVKLDRGELRTHQVLLAQIRKPTSDWFGDQPEAARNQLLSDAFVAAVTRTQKLLGPDASQWSWGRLHTATFRHPLATLSPIHEHAFNLGPVSRSGDGTTPNNTRANDDFQQIHGASYRHVLDLADWDRARATSVPGQSGQLGSIHYGDLLPLWADERYFPLSYSRNAVERETMHRLKLAP